MIDAPPTPKYTLAIPSTEIVGMALLPLFRLPDSAFLRDLFAKYGLDQVRPNVWYPAEEALAFLRELVACDDDAVDLANIGVAVAGLIPLPDGVETVANGLRMLNHLADATVRNRGDDRRQRPRRARAIRKTGDARTLGRRERLRPVPRAPRRSLQRGHAPRSPIGMGDGATGDHRAATLTARLLAP